MQNSPQQEPAKSQNDLGGFKESNITQESAFSSMASESATRNPSEDAETNKMFDQVNGEEGKEEQKTNIPFEQYKSFAYMAFTAGDELYGIGIDGLIYKFKSGGMPITLEQNDNARFEKLINVLARMMYEQQMPLSKALQWILFSASVLGAYGNLTMRHIQANKKEEPKGTYDDPVILKDKKQDRRGANFHKPDCPCIVCKSRRKKESEFQDAKVI